MKLKKVAAFFVATAMMVSMVGCGGTTTSGNNDTQQGNDTEDNADQSTTGDSTGTTSSNDSTSAGDSATVDSNSIKHEADDLADIIPDQTVTLNVYSQVSNYEGEQIGWFAQVLKDKFNVKLNIINDGTDGVFATRMESGNLGDIVIFGNDADQYQEAIKKGMLLDWEDDDIAKDYAPYVSATMQKALEKNRKVSGDGHVYGFGHDVAYEAGDYGDFDYHPDIRWDLYQQVGSPEVKELEDYVDVLKKMKEACPTSDSGKETYGVSLFNDWDGNMAMFVKATATCFFGVDEFEMGFYDAATGEFQGALEDDGYYTRCLRFYNKLYQEGLLDPDSMTQGYAGCMEDYQDGSAFFCIFGWMAAPMYNTSEHVKEGKMMLPLAAENQNTTVYGLNVNGCNRIWSIGENTQYPELCMAIINWLCTPEGRLVSEYGPKGVCWDYDEDGNSYITDFGYEVKNGAELEMPADSGYTGLWKDGQQQFNNTTWALNTLNPESNGQSYNYTYWPNVVNRDISEVEQSWRDATGAKSSRDYMASKKFTISKPNTYSAPVKDDDLDTTWNQVADCIKNGSWKAIYAKDDAEFDSIVAQMKKDADSYGYQTCVEWSKAEAAKRLASEE